MIANKKIIILGGGTMVHVKNHCSFCAPAYGTTAKQLQALCQELIPRMDTELYLTKMAGGKKLETNDDIQAFLSTIIQDLSVKIVFMNAAICDFKPTGIIAGKYAGRFKTSEGNITLEVTPTDKLLKSIREKRKDIFLVAFKTTCGATPDQQYVEGLRLLKTNSCNLVLANDTKTHVNMIITPEEARYSVTTDRNLALQELVSIAKFRSHLTFTRSTVVSGERVAWDSELVYPSLRTVVDYCIQNHAYKPFMGKTAGHFAAKVDDHTFLTSMRKTNFNELAANGLVKVVTNGPDTVIAYGAKPSVGGQSQRIIFSDHKDKEYDCIVHFHCPIRPGSLVPVVSQKEYECGSHECGQNTSNGLRQFGNLSAVMLDQHGPNIVFNHSIDPMEVICFIESNFDLSQKTDELPYDHQTWSL